MKNKIIATIICCLFCLFQVNAQKIISLTEIRKRMKSNRETNSLPCMLVLKDGDTLWGNKIEKKWNRKIEEGEWHLDEHVVNEEEVFYYQDKDGLHGILHLGTSGSKSYKIDMVKIVKGKINLFASNWKTRVTDTRFASDETRRDISKPREYTFVSYSFPQYYFQSKNRLFQLTYGSFKEIIADNSDALALYNATFSSSENPDKAVTNWEAIRKILEVYNK